MIGAASWLGLPILSHYADRYDRLFLGMTLLCLFFLMPILGAILYFSVKYHKSSVVERRVSLTSGDRKRVELAWMLIPFVLTGIFYVWSARLYVDWATPPGGALEISVIGKQWMWEFQHPGGQREIDSLHVPRGMPVRLTMISQDVIHAFFVPALRIKHDVLPGRYSLLWFQAEADGAFRFHCTEFCGTDHSRMSGTLVVMEPADYQAWLGRTQGEPGLAAAGAALFQAYGCSGCHGPNAAVRAPVLGGVYGSMVPLSDGRTVLADEAYLRDSILLPRRDVVAGFQPIMPSYQGRIGEADLLKLIAFLKSLPPGERP